MSTQVKDSPSQSSLFTPFVWYGPHFFSQQVSQPVGSPSIQAANQPFSQTGPTSCQSRLIWHDIMQAPISNNQKHPSADPRYAPFPTFPLLRGGLGAITPWLSHNAGRETIWRRRRVVFSLSLRPWAGIQDSVSNTCLLFTDRFSTAVQSRGLETPARSCQD